MGHIAPFMGQVLNSRIKLKVKKYRPLQQGLLPSSGIKEVRKAKILSILLERKNCSHKQLVEEMGVDRKTLRRYMRELISEGYACREESRHGLYSPTKKAIGQEVIFESLGNALRRAISYRYDLAKHGKIKIGKEWSETETNLFKFSNLVGAFVTYILIQSINPSNGFIEDRTRHEKPLLRESKWVENILTRLISGIDLLVVFTNAFPFYTNLREQVKAYKNLYPQIYRELSRLWDNIPKELRERKIQSFWSDLT